MLSGICKICYNVLLAQWMNPIIEETLRNKGPLNNRFYKRIKQLISFSIVFVTFYHLIETY